LAWQPDSLNQSLIAQVPQITVTRVGLAPGVVAQLTRGNNPKRAHGGQCARLRSPQRVLAVPRVVHDLALASTWQIEIAHEDVAGIEIARIAIPLRPSLVVVITRVGF
jgi:hypothetical protein